MKTLTLNDIFFAIVKRGLAQVMLVRETDQWVPISSVAFKRCVACATRLFSRWGLTKGDRLAILRENRPESAVADFASLLWGSVAVPIDATLALQQTANILCDPGAKVVVVSKEKQLQKVLSIKHQIAVEHVVVMDQLETTDAVHTRRMLQAGRAERVAELDDRAGTINADDLASIIYTSGTTGNSRGVQRSHVIFTSNLHHSLERRAEGIKFPARGTTFGHSVLGA